jgi:hypothetical protein
MLPFCSQPSDPDARTFTGVAMSSINATIPVATVFLTAIVILLSR